MKPTLHPVVSLFPQLSDDNNAKLKESIKKVGCQVPVMLWFGSDSTKYIIDGGHRSVICDDLGVNYPVQEFEGTEEEAINLAWTLNDDRRHQSPKQRLEAAAKLAELLSVAADKRMKAGTLPPIGGRVTSAQQAAKMTGEKTRSVERAQSVLRNGTPELQEAWKNDTISTSDAAAVAKEHPRVQREAVRAVAKGKKKTAKAAVEDISKTPDDPPELSFEDQCKEDNGRIEGFCRKLMTFFQDNMPDVKSLHHNNLKESALSKIKAVCNTLRVGKYHDKPCPRCDGGGCDICKRESDFGAVTKLTYDQIGARK